MALPRGFAGAAVDHQVVQLLGDVGIEVIVSIRKAASCRQPRSEASRLAEREFPSVSGVPWSA